MVEQSVRQMSQSEAIATAENYVNSIRSLGILVRKAFLFGSFAQGRQSEWSDIDVALVADNFTGFSVTDKIPFRRLHAKKEFMDIETHTFPTSSLKDHNAFLEEIIKTGIEIC